MLAARMAGRVALIGPMAAETVGPDHAPSTPVDVSPLAYIMFTSGTTGHPKGVAVHRSNLAAYLSSIAGVVPLSVGTRCSQMFDLSFDLSVHDMFHTWASGGVLYVPNAKEVLDPIGFAKRHRLECWFSVPSMVARAARAGQLASGALSDLQFSLFCGEPLPVSLAEQWVQVAPNSQILNLYGPTEATIAITAHHFVPGASTYSGLSTVPIGEPLDGSELQIVNTDELPSETGELLLGGPQISAGYMNDPLLQADRFIARCFAGAASTRWYRTGDAVRATASGALAFEGRLDDQVKINGYRVELQDVDEALRRAAGTREVATIAWTRRGSTILIGFVCGSTRSTSEILVECRRTLPTYMRPRRILTVDQMPTSVSGKLDRKALAAMLSAPRPRQGESGGVGETLL